MADDGKLASNARRCRKGRIPPSDGPKPPWPTRFRRECWPPSGRPLAPTPSMLPVQHVGRRGRQRPGQHAMAATRGTRSRSSPQICAARAAPHREGERRVARGRGIFAHKRRQLVHGPSVPPSAAKSLAFPRVDMRLHRAQRQAENCRRLGVRKLPGQAQRRGRALIRREPRQRPLHVEARVRCVLCRNGVSGAPSIATASRRSRRNNERRADQKFAVRDAPSATAGNRAPVRSLPRVCQAARNVSCARSSASA